MGFSGKFGIDSIKVKMKLLNENMEKMGETAYKKAIKAAEEIAGLFCVSDKMLLTISYIFEQMKEVTPLALQKILYFIQGIYMVIFGKPLYKEDCMAWIHGPVYEEVYDLFRDFKYNPIEDNRFAIFKDRFEELSEQEKKIIDLVINTFGKYSGKVLEDITHEELPWKNARVGYEPSEPSREIISKDEITIRSSAAEYLTYVASVGDQQDSIEMRYEDENIWLTQKMMATLYDVDVRTINEHIKRIYSDSELEEDSTIRNFRIVQTEGSRQVTRNIKHYNLQMIIAVGFKVNSERAVQFRKWVNQIAKDYTIKGWVMDDERLKRGTYLTEKYFDEQLERIREIRAKGSFIRR